MDGNEPERVRLDGSKIMLFIVLGFIASSLNQFAPWNSDPKKIIVVDERGDPIQWPKEWRIRP